MPSQAYISAVNARVNEEIFVTLIRFVHEDIDPVDFPNGICVCDHSENLTSNGIEYVAWPFRHTRPDKGGDTQDATIPIEIDDVDPVIKRELLGISGAAPVAYVSTVLASDPDTVEEGPDEFEVKSAKMDGFIITGRLGIAPVLNMRYGRYTVNPKTCPGAF